MCGRPQKYSESLRLCSMRRFISDNPVTASLSRGGSLHEDRAYGAEVSTLRRPCQYKALITAVIRDFHVHPTPEHLRTIAGKSLFWLTMSWSWMAVPTLEGEMALQTARSSLTRTQALTAGEETGRFTNYQKKWAP